MRIDTLLAQAKSVLKQADIEAYALDAEILLQKATGLSRVKLLTSPEFEIDAEQTAEFLRYIKERAAHRPVKYIVGECEFMSLPFYVDEAVLIPRPDTEVLVEQAIAFAKSFPAEGLSILDLCTGSGCIAVSLAHFCPAATVTATDISAEALAVAEKNAKQNSVDSRVNFRQGDLFGNIQEQFDLIVSNPPYIEAATIDTLESDVKDFEPRGALSGGADGLDFYRRIVADAPSYLKANGALYMEIGYNQGAAVTELLTAGSYKNIAIIKDLAGHDRVVRGNV